MPEYTVTEAAERIGISRRAVLKRLALGTLKGRRVNRDWVISAAVVDGAHRETAGRKPKKRRMKKESI